MMRFQTLSLLLLLASATQAQSWWKDAVFYEVFVRSFQDSDGDGIGDLQGLINRLDYLNDGVPGSGNDLEIDAIWLMPVSHSPSYHGYDVTDYREVESDYGNNVLFRTLMDSAHSRGIKIIVDLVMNHSSSAHPWFVSARNNASSPFRNWYHFNNSYPGYSGPWGQTVWHNTGSGDYFYGLFWDGMPDLNVSNPDTRNEIFDIAHFWIDSMGVDGFRLDAIKHLGEQGSPSSSSFTASHTDSTFSFLNLFRDEYKAGNPDIFTVGEVWSATSEIVPYVGQNGVDLCFDFDLSYALRNSVNAGDEEEVRNQIAELLSIWPDRDWAAFLSNHDQDRIMSQFGSSTDKARVAASVLLALPGTPFIYYGEEIGLRGTGDHLNIRKPMSWNGSAGAGFTSGSPWQSLHSDYTSRNVEDQQADPNSIWSSYRQFIGFRQQLPEWNSGKFYLLNDGSNNLFSFARADGTDWSLVVANLSNSDISSEGLSLPASLIPEGTYPMQDLTSGSAVASIPVYSSGSFADWNPVTTWAARSVYVFRFSGPPTAAPTGIPPGLTWTPAAPLQNQTVTITVSDPDYDPTLHWGVTVDGSQWNNPIPPYRPAGSVLYGGTGPAVQSPMTNDGSGNYSITLGPFNDPLQDIETVNFVIAYPTGPWDNNGLADYHIPIISSNCNTPTDLNSSPLAGNKTLLSWTESAAATGYKLQGRQAGGSVKNVNMGPVADFTTPALVPGATYQWRLSAKCDGVISDYSAVQSFSVPLVRERAEITVVPNPANDILQVYADGEEVRLINLNGDVVATNAGGQNGLFQLNVRDLPRGAYLVQCGRAHHLIVLQ